MLQGFSSIRKLEKVIFEKFKVLQVFKQPFCVEKWLKFCPKIIFLQVNQKSSSSRSKKKSWYIYFQALITMLHDFAAILVRKTCNLMNEVETLKIPKSSLMNFVFSIFEIHIIKKPVNCMNEACKLYECRKNILAILW